MKYIAYNDFYSPKWLDELSADARDNVVTVTFQIEYSQKSRFKVRYFGCKRDQYYVLLVGAAHPKSKLA